MKKKKSIHIQVMDGCLLSFKNITHKMLLIELAINYYIKFLIFNIIMTLFYLFILALVELAMI